ncbi:MAG: hypothetical protein WD532_01940 [Acidimicrobiia bacterium]
MTKIRLPNPWIAIPSVVLGLLGGWVTYLVMELSCRVESDEAVQTCTGLALSLATVVFVLATIGMAVVLVLVYRSIAEYRDAQAKGEEPAGPGCETN